MDSNINPPRTTVYPCDSCGTDTTVDGDGACPDTGGQHTVDIAFHHRHAHNSEDPFGRDPDCHLCVSEITFRPDVHRVHLYGWVKNWNDAETPVRAMLFGQLIKHAAGLVEHYPSDLYHDALWIEQNVNGPTGFYWMARRHGTNIASTAIVQEQISTTEPRSLYWVALTEDDGQWITTFTELVHVRDTEPPCLTAGSGSTTTDHTRRR